jgi:hypothetical protein
VDRESLSVVFYGEGQIPLPWAIDCPVRFDTWLAFAKTPQVPPPRVDVILAVNQEHGVRRLLDHLSGVGVLNASQPIPAGSFVVASLTFDELVRAILPLTSLFGVVRLAKTVSKSDLLVAATEPDRLQLGTHFATEGGSERVDESKRHLVWLLQLLVAVEVSAATPQATKRSKSAQQMAAQRGAAIKKVAVMLRKAVAENPATHPSLKPGNEVFDRPRSYLLTSVSTNRTARPAVSRSRQTVKADAAETVFAIDCREINWAVVDSGIDAKHPAFAEWDTSTTPPEQVHAPPRVVRAFDLVHARETLFAERKDNGLIDWELALPCLEMPVPGHQAFAGTLRPQKRYERPGHPHGTHVAGVLGGFWPKFALRGMCPTIRLYDFRVLDAAGQGNEFSIVMALQAIRHINEQMGRLAIAGVNLSLSVPHLVATHSCGWTPVCIECDRLVRSGVVVVTAAGNAGFAGSSGTLETDYNTVSITDPGNADSVITVGSTHRTDPHRNGVSYFSSRGPTADGRLKPDLLAPGEGIVGSAPSDEILAMHGTSQAAAHVSGAAAMLMARHRELLGRPERVKQILCSTATDLGRERSFQGFGLVDVLRAMQSV